MTSPLTTARRSMIGAALFLAILAPTPGLGAAPPAAADAATREPTPAERDACLQDFRRLCPGVRRGGGRVRQCFEAHFSELSPMCQRAVEASRAKHD